MVAIIDAYFMTLNEAKMVPKHYQVIMSKERKTKIEPKNDGLLVLPSLFSKRKNK